MPLLRPLQGRRVLARDRRGSSSPVLVKTDEGPHFVKLRGAAQGTASLVAEVVVGAIADRLDLPVPPRRVVSLAADTPTDDRNDELADLLAASTGDNLGFCFLENARPFVERDLDNVDADFASRVRWLDWLVMNPDRGPENPNLVVQGRNLWLIDHGAALPFQHDWASVTEQAPARPGRPFPHVLEGRATRMRVWDAKLTGRVTRELLADALAEVPESFLAPLVRPEPAPDAVARRRAAYAAFLWKRLRGPRPAGVGWS